MEYILHWGGTFLSTRKVKRISTKWTVADAKQRANKRDDLLIFYNNTVKKSMLNQEHS